ncbi:MAG: DUF86 domain-containing protein [Anaerolineae bacterium]|nr:DUF86 domain-containing protein [Anaerolineae bacterium]
MPRAYKLYLDDIIEAARFIAEQIEGLTYEDFLADRMRLNALLHQLMIIGEAARHIPDSVRQLAPDVPWNEITGTRNIIVHGYFSLDYALLWYILREEIPPLRRRIDLLLRELP